MYPDFKPHYDINEIKNYELFIGPQGEYYKVKTIKESDENMTHYNWAHKYLQKHKLLELFKQEIKELNLDDYNSIIINLCGFIRYTHVDYYGTPVIDIPDYFKYGKTVTEKQIISLHHLMHSKNESRFYEPFLENVKKNSYDGSIYRKMVDNYIEKLIIEGRSQTK